MLFGSKWAEKLLYRRSGYNDNQLSDSRPYTSRKLVTEETCISHRKATKQVMVILHRLALFYFNYLSHHQLPVTITHSGEDAKCLMAPLLIEIKSEECSEQSYTTTRNTSARKAPINFVKANRRALQEQQRNNKSAAIQKEHKDKKKQLKIELKKQRMFGNINSRLHNPISSSIDVRDTNESMQPLPLNLDDNCRNNQVHIAFGRRVPSSSQSSVISKLEQISLPSSDTFVRHKSYGKIPAYILNRRAKIEQEEHNRLLKEQNAPPAPGLVLLEEFERLETLRILDENERIERDNLRNIPFSMNTQRAARLRETIELRLKEIEDAKTIFSKDRVFVAKNDD